MRTLAIVVAAVSMLGLLGCSSQQGGPVGSDQGFKIGVPMFAVKVEQGETKDAKIKLDRGKYFKQDVTIALTASEGIAVKPTEVTVKANEKADVPIEITAPKDAAIGEYRIRVKATPERGESAAMDVKVKVTAPEGD